MTALVTKRNPAATRTPLSSADEDMFVATLRFPIWPYNSKIRVGDELEMATGFVLNKPELVIGIFGKFLLGSLIIKASLFMKAGLILERSNVGLALLLSPLGSEKFLAFQ
jgi:hypothetical protein